MNLRNDPKIFTIRNILEIKGFFVEVDGNGISLNMDRMGIPNAVLEFYVLKKSPEQLRARLRKKVHNVHSEFDGLCFHMASDLEYMRKKVHDGLLGVAALDKFYYYGYRKDTHYYYAHIRMSEQPPEIVLRQKLVEKALVQLEGVDPRTFRQGLDMTGLPRSNIVRLALSRIFRNAVGCEEFIHASAEEALKIVNAEEWKTLRTLINTNQVHFMSNMIYMLWEEVSRIYMNKAWENLHS